MAIPDFQSSISPLLAYTSDNNEHSYRDTAENLAVYFKLTPDERQELLPSGRTAVFDNRVGWAKMHLLKAGLLESPRRAIFKISARGHQVLAQNPLQIDMRFLKQFPEYAEFLKPTNGTGTVDAVTEQIDSSKATPEEILENSYQSIHRTLAQDLLQKIKASPPVFFERLVVELLVKMGYGGSLKDAGRATSLTNDGGIDGIIKEDKLGLDFIYVQAKRWDSQSVGRPDIQ